MHDAGARATVQLRLRRLEGLLRHRLVATADGQLDGLDESPHAA